MIEDETDDFVFVLVVHSMMKFPFIEYDSIKGRQESEQEITDCWKEEVFSVLSQDPSILLLRYTDIFLHQFSNFTLLKWEFYFLFQNVWHSIITEQECELLFAWFDFLHPSEFFSFFW